MDGDLQALAQKALELDSLSPLIEHDPAECETCSEYQAEFLTFAREAELEELQREPQKKGWLR